MPQVGDKVKPGKSEMVYTVSKVSDDGSEVNLYVPDTTLERFRVRTDSLTFVERKPPTRSPQPSPSSTEASCWSVSRPSSAIVLSSQTMTSTY
jgi:hypothetical protein